MRLQVVIFAFNEEPTIAAVVRAVPREIDGVDEVRVTVIDDGSTDRTAEAARGAGAAVVSHGRNRGLGWAFQSGVREALEHEADIMVTVDGDGQFDPGQIPELIGPILAGRAEMTTCSRFMDSALTPRTPRREAEDSLGLLSLSPRIHPRRTVEWETPAGVATRIEG